LDWNSTLVYRQIDGVDRSMTGGDVPFSGEFRFRTDYHQKYLGKKLKGATESH
jgi:hypothetical protein